MANEKKTIKTEWIAGKYYVYPVHNSVKNWRFNEGEEEEAKLCHAMAVLAEKNKIDINEFKYFFVASLRSLKSEIDWSK